MLAALRSAPLGRPWRGDGLDVWGRIAEWEDQAPPGEPGTRPIEPADAAARLALLLERSGLDEARPTQAVFAAEAALPRPFIPGIHRHIPVSASLDRDTPVPYLAPATVLERIAAAKGSSA